MIRIEDLSLTLGAFSLRGVELSIEEGEYIVLLGPTGAGKSVLVECVVGLHRPRSGRILIGGRDVTALDPEQRQVGFVPQDYALFPNMTVRKNLAFGLAARGRPATEIARRTDEMMTRLGLGHLGDRRPLTLSGGEKQRAALGRALVVEPKILLLDEPLSALDENLRTDLARQLRQIQRQAGSSFLHVCHSFEEASQVGDRVAIMNRGAIEQVGTIEEVLRRPKNLFVARFTRTRNLLEGHAERAGQGCRVTLAGGALVVDSAGRLEGPVVVGIRPEEIEILGAPDPGGSLIEGTVTGLSLMPHHVEVTLDVGVPLVACAPWAVGDRDLEVGQPVSVHMRPERVLVFPRGGGRPTIQ